MSISSWQDCSEIEPLLKQHASDLSRFEIISADDVVDMNANPLVALKSGRKTSMWKAIDLVNSQMADACISAGNTGTLLIISRYLLKTIDGIQRPAIGSVFQQCLARSVLDLGAMWTAQRIICINLLYGRRITQRQTS